VEESGFAIEISGPRILLEGKGLPGALFEPSEDVGMEGRHSRLVMKDRLDFEEPKQGLDRRRCFASFPPAER
jgi:hypothetical protein